MKIIFTIPKAEQVLEKTSWKPERNMSLVVAFTHKIEDVVYSISHYKLLVHMKNWRLTMTQRFFWCLWTAFTFRFMEFFWWYYYSQFMCHLLPYIHFLHNQNNHLFQFLYFYPKESFYLSNNLPEWTGLQTIDFN